NDRNTHNKEHPPGNGGSPEEETPEEPTYPPPPVPVPDQEDPGETRRVDSQQEKWVARADLSKQRNKLVGKQHEERHRHPAEAKGEHHERPQDAGVRGEWPPSLNMFICNTCRHTDLLFL